MYNDSGDFAILSAGGKHKLFISRKGCIGSKVRARLALVSRGSTRRHSSHAGTQAERPAAIQIFKVTLGELLDAVSLGVLPRYSGVSGAGEEISHSLSSENCFLALQMGMKITKEEWPVMSKSISRRPEEALNEVCAKGVGIPDKARLRTINSLAAIGSSYVWGDGELEHPTGMTTC